MALTGLPGIEKLVDDILVMGATKEELLERTERVIKRCQESNITLNNKKIQIGQSVKFGGHIITSEGSSPDPDKVRAIKDFPTPTNVTDVRSFMGLSNQFMDYLPDLKQNLEPIKDLLKKTERIFVDKRSCSGNGTSQDLDHGGKCIGKVRSGQALGIGHGCEQKRIGLRIVAN